MPLDTLNLMNEIGSAEASVSASNLQTPVIAMLPASIAFCEQACGQLRAVLDQKGLRDWRIFTGPKLDIADIDGHFDVVGGSLAGWEPLAATTRGGEPVSIVEEGTAGLWIATGGFIHLEASNIVVARWVWTDEGGLQRRNLHLVAAPSIKEFAELSKKIKRNRRAKSANVWQFISGHVNRDGPRVPRAPVEAGDLIMSSSLRDRVKNDVLSFFTEPVVQMYRSLKVPYRRGVLLHGQPGNGKTSLIRLVGAELPSIPFLILRPDAVFNTNNFNEVVRRWKELSPAVLVIEDLNWLLQKLNLSTFLNQLDGIDEAPNYSGGGNSTRAGEGLMLIATSNDPGSLDPAINNRPGRFDVVIEITSPADDLRHQFLVEKLPMLDAEVVRKVVSLSRGFSFAHLQELLRLSGLIALSAQRSERTSTDVIRAAEEIGRAQDQALHGFPSSKDPEFGLHHLRTLTKEQ